MAPPIAVAINSGGAAPLRNAKAPLATPTAAVICKFEYGGVVDSISASLAAISRGATPNPAVLANCSSAAIRIALIPGGPISRIAVLQTPDRRRLAVMLSRDRETDTASKLNLRAITSTQCRVRLAVFPARIIAAPNDKRTSAASAGVATEVTSSSLPESKVMQHRNSARRGSGRGVVAMSDL
jgi:hypothetical protein